MANHSKPNTGRENSFFLLKREAFQTYLIQVALLFFWTILGGCLRFFQLTAKPPWTDEFATMVFSLGNSYQSVPLNQVIDIDTLLQPIKFNPQATIYDVISLIIHQDNHPPLYFILSHLWFNLFPDSEPYLSLWQGRSLSALFGVLSVPAIYFLARFAFNSPLVAQLSAMAMAVSPYGIFLAQEARHYTLAILCVILSLFCLIFASKCINYETPIPIWLVLLWIVINFLGLSVHYFFIITIFGEVITLFVLIFKKNRSYRLNNRDLNNIGLVSLVFIASIGAILSWFLFVIPQDYGNGMTEWIRQDNRNLLALISPVFQLLAAWITMLSLLPVESDSVVIVIISGLLMLSFFIWTIPQLYWGLKVAGKQAKFSLGTLVLMIFIVAVIALFILITYFLGMDITRGARYSFVYFPAVILLLSTSMSIIWHRDKRGKLVIKLILLMGLLSSITVCLNLGYQKYYEPDKLSNIITTNSTGSVLIATSHKNLVETGEMMGIAWEINPKKLSPKTFFLLVNQDATFSATTTLKENWKLLSRPLDVWLVNFQAPVELNECLVAPEKLPHINGYNYQHYHCAKL